MKPFVRPGVLLLVLALCLLAGCGKPAEDDVSMGFDAPAATATAKTTGKPVNTPAPGASATPAGAAAVPTPYVPAEPTPTSAVRVEDLDGESKATPPPKRTYEEYQAINDDVIGWIKISGTEIDYPVVAASDNEYYLTRDVEKQSSDYGAIFMDYRCATNSKHMIIHGHNMKNGTMFGALHNYATKECYDAHRDIKLKFGNTEHTYRIFATYTVDASNAKYYAYTDHVFANDESFALTMNTLAEGSRHAVDTTVQPGDQVLTLSTCNRVDYSNGREVVHAVRIS